MIKSNGAIGEKSTQGDDPVVKRKGSWSLLWKRSRAVMRMEMTDVYGIQNIF